MKFINLKGVAFLCAVILVIGAAFIVLRPFSENARAGVNANVKNDDLQNVQKASTGEYDIERLMSERSVGSDDAPITMIEFSSLSCGHCGSFHQTTFDQIKENYIDTGKLKVVFVEFAFNAPALRAAQLARCLPESRYFPFTTILFKTQADWAYNTDYLERLTQNAKLAGMNEKGIEACINNEKLQEALVENMQKAQEKWNVDSTPSFVINDGAEKIIGNQPYSTFRQTFEKLLAQNDTSQN